MPWGCSREPGARRVNGGLAPRSTELTAGFALYWTSFGFYSFFILSFCFFHCPQLWGPGFASAITGCSAPGCPAHSIPHPCLPTGCPVVPCCGDGTVPPLWPRPEQLTDPAWRSGFQSHPCSHQLPVHTCPSKLPGPVFAQAQMPPGLRQPRAPRLAHGPPPATQ